MFNFFLLYVNYFTTKRNSQSYCLFLQDMLILMKFFLCISEMTVLTRMLSKYANAIQTTYSLLIYCKLLSQANFKSGLIHNFQVLCERQQGIGILVSNVPKETNACFSLREPTEVKHLITSFQHLL